MFAYESYQHDRSADLRRRADHHRLVREAVAARKERRRSARSRSTDSTKWVKAA